ncbi:TRAP transporter small permease [Cochlodiniinecator piscidefendens]|uniref:TRAP transporter small permease n=1 Tax=Cochlodiniinecator piscidefendens TaxID=2715756 RepID=UPI00140C61A5|nr:TRAP transporter small permease [Cochlodiniinecator piscidefendens]
MTNLGKAARRFLDGLYLTGGILASLFLIAILFLIVVQMVARWTGEAFVGAPDYAGYCMAASSFLALAYALNKGNHIRVSLLLSALGKYRRIGEIWCFSVGTFLSLFFAYYAIKTMMGSIRWNDISPGQDATPLWIPQMAMVAGVCLLAIAFIDHLVRLLFVGNHNIQEEALDAHTE